MSESITTVTVPQLGVNDEEATIVEWYKSDFDKVKSGDPLCSLETAKAVYDVEAPASGVFVHLCDEQEIAAINQPIGLIGKDKASLEKAKQEHSPKKSKQAGSSAADGETKATAKAVKLAEKLGVDLNEITLDRIIKESDVTAHYEKNSKTETIPISKLNWDKKYQPVAIYGAGRGALTIKEALELGTEYRPVCFLDDDPAHPVTLADLPVYHGSKLEELKQSGITDIACEIAGGNIRLRIREKCIKAGFNLINVIHPESFIAPSVKIGIGNFVKAGAIVETNTEIGDCCIIDNGVAIAHDNIIEDGCHLAPGVTLGSSIRLGELTVLGIGASVSTGITIGRSSIIAVGSAVVKDIPDYSIVDGVPGKVVGERKK